MNVRDLMAKRANLVGEARGVVEAAEKENRNLTTEEQARYDKLMADVLDLSERINRAAALAEEETRANSARGQGTEMRNQPEQGEQRSDNPRGTPEYRKAFGSWLRGGMGALSGIEHRALQADVATSGGFLVTPMQFVNDLIQAVDNQTWVRQFATVMPVPTAASLGVPSLETDPSDPAWTSEIGTGSEDSSMAFGRRELYPHPLAKRIKLSNKLLRQVPSAETLVRDRLAYKFAVTMENAYLNGDGQNKPLGVFVANADGVSTARDMSTGNTSTSVTFEGLINAKYALKGQYWPRARWMFHRDGLKEIAKLRDGSGGAGTGQFLWQPSVQEGQPDRILGLPVVASEYVPNTFTTGLYVGILADWSYYWIADALDMQVQRLVELYAETNQVGIIGRMESDGMPVLAEAFVRVKLA